MKKSLITIAVALILLPASLLADIPGEYKIVVPQIPPAPRSVDKVRLVEVFAFDCVHCYYFNRDMLPKLKSKFGDKLVFEPKPIGWRGHDPGRLYFIAEEKGKGHDVMMTIFQMIFDYGLGQQMFTRDKLQFVAKKHQLDKEFKSLMDAPRIVKQMNRSVQYSQIKNVDSTPTLIIEESIIPVRRYSNLVLIINSLLKNPVK
ncbi:MAG: thioredoxin domain-containing protein [Proteobacteria bacterium]|nr:thioredoxin domain-containing protein [Pseudomonadota bacterium]